MSATDSIFTVHTLELAEGLTVGQIASWVDRLQENGCWSAHPVVPRRRADGSIYLRVEVRKK